MRPSPWLEAEPYRISMPGYESCSGESFGAFIVPAQKLGTELRILASDGRGARLEFGDLYAGDHVSVSTPTRPPTWAEMCFVKRLFWGDDETVVQFHMPVSEHINCHPHTLHLWKSQLVEFPKPPRLMV